MELTELPVVSEVRVKGLMAGVECTLDPENPNEERDAKFASEIDRICQSEGLLLRPVYNTCVMSPPLTITEQQIKELVRILKLGIEQASANI